MAVHTATPAKALYSTQLPIAPPSGVKQADADYRPLHDAAWWADHTKNFRFDKEDLNDEAAYNRVLWEGTMGDQPYPTTRTGAEPHDD